MIKVLSVDDHPLLREGIATLVNAESDMKLIAEATNGLEAIEKFRHLHCGGDCQEPRHEYTRQAWRQRPDPRRHAGAKARNHRTVDPPNVG
jgi:CheY-like chemotaxis protein